MNHSINQRKTLASLANKIKNLCESNPEAPLSPIELELIKKQTLDLYDNLIHFHQTENKLSLEKPTAVEETFQNSMASIENVATESTEAPNEEAVTKTEPEAKEEKPILKETQVNRPIQFELLVDGIETEKTPIEEKETETPVVEDATPMESTSLETVPEEKGEVVKNEIKIESSDETEILEPEIKEDQVTAKEVQQDLDYSSIDESDLAGKFGNAPIHDLKKEISIAKKFEFINSLFNGSVEKYAYAIHYINNLNNGDEAFAYLWEIKAENNWDEEDDNFLELANMVRRRYKS